MDTLYSWVHLEVMIENAIKLFWMLPMFYNVNIKKMAVVSSLLLLQKLELKYHASTPFLCVWCFHSILILTSTTFVGLSKRTTTDGLRNAFAKFGEVVHGMILLLPWPFFSCFEFWASHFSSNCSSSCDRPCLRMFERVWLCKVWYNWRSSERNRRNGWKGIWLFNA